MYGAADYVANDDPVGVGVAGAARQPANHEGVNR